MAHNMDAFTDTFLEGLRRDISRWKADLSMMDIGEDAQGKYLQTSEIRSWLEAGEEIFARYERRDA